MLKKEIDAALKLFKDAADNGVVDAQLRYAFTYGLKDVSKMVNYMILAADNRNATVLYNFRRYLSEWKIWSTS